MQTNPAVRLYFILTSIPSLKIGEVRPNPYQPQMKSTLRKLIDVAKLVGLSHNRK